MTRFLSESLQAPEPVFRNGLRRLEQANGNPSTDIRLSAEVMRATKVKLHELGLDAHDTTPEELYHALQERLKTDDERLVKTLRTKAATHVSAEGDLMAGMLHVLHELPLARSCFALKTSRFKTLIKKQPPKKAMKQLGYRSLDSLLKHEPAASVLAAAKLCESPTWQRSLLEQYKKLKPSDFENRQLSIVHPTSKNWKALANESVAASKHNLLGFSELGALVLLPLPAETPAGAATASLALAIHGLNQIRADATYLKLSQVRADFGTVVREVAASEPTLQARLLDQPVSWHLLQRYYARSKQFFQRELFEPYLELEDLSWHAVEKVLTTIEPSFAFWQDSAHLGVLHEGEPVSLNVLDAALNYCNRLPFEKRITAHFQKSLWHELLLRYLKPEAVEQTILHELQPELAPETALID